MMPDSMDVEKVDEAPQGGGGAADPGELVLKIKTLDGKQFDVHVQKAAVVSALKEKIAGPSGVPAASQRLVFRGRVLKDDQPLTSYAISDGSTVHLVSRLSSSEEGGGADATPSTPQGFQPGTQNASSTFAIPGGGRTTIHVGTINMGGSESPGPPLNLGSIITGVLSSIGLAGNLGTVPGLSPEAATARTPDTAGPRSSRQSQQTGAEGQRQQQQQQQQQGQGRPAGAQANVDPTFGAFWGSMPGMGPQHGGFPGQPPWAVGMGEGQVHGGRAMPGPSGTWQVVVPNGQEYTGRDAVQTMSEYMWRLDNMMQGAPTTPFPQGPTTERTPRQAVECLARNARQLESLLRGPVGSAVERLAQRLERNRTTSGASERQRLQEEVRQQAQVLEQVGPLMLELAAVAGSIDTGTSADNVQLERNSHSGFINAFGPNPVIMHIPRGAQRPPAQENRAGGRRQQQQQPQQDEQQRQQQPQQQQQQQPQQQRQPQSQQQGQQPSGAEGQGSVQLQDAVQLLLSQQQLIRQLQHVQNLQHQQLADSHHIASAIMSGLQQQQQQQQQQQGSGAQRQAGQPQPPGAQGPAAPGSMGAGHAPGSHTHPVTITVEATNIPLGPGFFPGFPGAFGAPGGMMQGAMPVPMPGPAPGSTGAPQPTPGAGQSAPAGAGGAAAGSTTGAPAVQVQTVVMQVDENGVMRPIAATGATGEVDALDEPALDEGRRGVPGGPVPGMTFPAQAQPLGMPPGMWAAQPLMGLAPVIPGHFPAPTIVPMPGVPLAVPGAPVYVAGAAPVTPLHAHGVPAGGVAPGMPAPPTFLPGQTGPGAPLVIAPAGHHVVQFPANVAVVSGGPGPAPTVVVLPQPPQHGPPASGASRQQQPGQPGQARSGGGEQAAGLQGDASASAQQQQREGANEGQGQRGQTGVQGEQLQALLGALARAVQAAVVPHNTDASAGQQGGTAEAAGQQQGERGGADVPMSEARREGHREPGSSGSAGADARPTSGGGAPGDVPSVNVSQLLSSLAPLVASFASTLQQNQQGRRQEQAGQGQPSTAGAQPEAPRARGTGQEPSAERERSAGPAGWSPLPERGVPQPPRPPPPSPPPSFKGPAGEATSSVPGAAASGSAEPQGSEGGARPSAAEAAASPLGLGGLGLRPERRARKPKAEAASPMSQGTTPVSRSLGQSSQPSEAPAAAAAAAAGGPLAGAAASQPVPGGMVLPPGFPAGLMQSGALGAPGAGGLDLGRMMGEMMSNPEMMRMASSLASQLGPSMGTLQGASASTEGGGSLGGAPGGGPGGPPVDLSAILSQVLRPPTSGNTGGTPGGGPGGPPVDLRAILGQVLRPSSAGNTGGVPGGAPGAPPVDLGAILGQVLAPHGAGNTCGAPRGMPGAPWGLDLNALLGQVMSNPDVNRMAEAFAAQAAGAGGAAGGVPGAGGGRGAAPGGLDGLLGQMMPMMSQVLGQLGDQGRRPGTQLQGGQDEDWRRFLSEDEAKAWEQRLREDRDAQAQQSQQRPFSDSYLNGQRRAPRDMLAPIEEAAKRLQAGGPSAPAAALDAVSRAAADSMDARLTKPEPSGAPQAASGFDPLRTRARAAPLQPLSEEERAKLVSSVSSDQELAKTTPITGGVPDPSGAQEQCLGKRKGPRSEDGRDGSDGDAVHGKVPRL